MSVYRTIGPLVLKCDKIVHFFGPIKSCFKQSFLVDPLLDESVLHIFLAKYPKKMLIEPYNDGKVNHFLLPHSKEYDRFTTMPIEGG